MQPKRELAIVLVDDDIDELEALCSGIESIYEESGIAVETYSSPNEALAGVSYLVTHNTQIPLIIVDCAMPHMDSITLVRSLGDEIPDPKPHFVMISNDSEQPAITEAINSGLIKSCVAKPWRVKQLHQQLKSLTSDWIITNALDQTAYYQKLVSHKAYSQAVRTLSHQLGSLKKIFFDSSSVSDDALIDSLVVELQLFTASCHPSHGRISSFQAFDVLMKENAPGNRELWIVLEGQVKHVKTISGRQHEILIGKKGSIIGLTSFIERHPFFSTVIAEQPVTVACITADGLELLLSENETFFTLFFNYMLRQQRRRYIESSIRKTQLAETLEQLKATQSKLVESEKMVLLGQMTAGIAHELNNPVSAVVRGVEHLSNNLKALLQENNDPQMRDMGMAILEKSSTQVAPSSMEVRQKAKPFMDHLGSINKARKAVQIGLENVADLANLQAQTALDEDQILDYLSHYHQLGMFLKNVEHCASRISVLVKGLKNYSRSDGESCEMLNIVEGIDDTLMVLSNKAKRFSVHKHYHDVPQIMGYAASLNQVWTNLIANAFDAMEAGGRLDINVDYSDDKQSILVQIKDTGPGIPESIKEKIFMPQFTTKRGSNFGLGLGLSISKNIVLKHCGEISVQSTDGNGSIFTVKLPINTDEEAS